MIVKKEDDMMKRIDEKYKLDSNIVKNYVDAINSMMEPMNLKY